MSAPKPASILAPYISQALAAVSKAGVKAGGDTQIEVEVRFEDVVIGVFERVKQGLLKRTPARIIQSTDYIANGVRRTLLAVPVEPTAGEKEAGVRTMRYQPVSIVKTQLWTHKSEEYPLKLVVSTERQVKEAVVTSDASYRTGADLIRSKQRWEFGYYPGNEILVHLTHVTQEEKGQPPSSRFEIEAEINGPITKESLDKLDRVVTPLLMPLIYDTRFLYTKAQRLAVVNDYNRILGLPESKDGKLNHEAMVQARNLKRRDCVWGGLLGGAINYAITVKAEGLRKQLMVHDTGIYLLFPPREINRVTPNIQGFENAIGTILDGEHIPPERRVGKGLEIKAPVYYLPFDVMAYNGNISVQSKSLFDRLSIRDIFARRFSPTSLDLVVAIKEFVPLGKSVEELEAAIAHVKATVRELPYKTDGFMVTPIEAPYNPHSDHVPLHKRILTELPDTCKLKEWEELTADMRVEWVLDGDAPGILLVNRQIRTPGKKPRVERVRWAGNSYNPFDPTTQVIWNSPVLRGIPSGSVVEFGPRLAADHETILLQAIRVRTDKAEPNREEIVNDVWDDINNPLELATLEGKTLALAFQWHNRIKKALFEDIPEGANVVDIGAGQGGDLSKMRHLNRILAVEPDEKKLTEYKRRAGIQRGTEAPMSSKVSLLVAGGEESKRIIEAASEWFNWGKPLPAGGKRPPLYVTMMLSLSFFWKDAAMLQGLANTLQGLRAAYRASGGTEPVRFMFFTIEGKATLDMVKALGTNFTLGQASFHFEQPNKLLVHIKDSIVEDQEEYLVNLPELVSVAHLKDVVVTPATGEKFLSQSAQLYTSMYVYGSAEIEEPTVDAGLPLVEEIAKTPPMEEKPKMEPAPRVKQMTTPDSEGIKPLLVEIKQLEALPVDETMLTTGAREETQGAAIVSKGDDEKQLVATTILPDNISMIVLPAGVKEYWRVATLHNGNSFFHSLLKITNKRYRRMGASARLSMAANLRKELATILLTINAWNFPTEDEVRDALYGGVDPRKAMDPESLGAKLPLNCYYYTVSDGELHNTMTRVEGTLRGYDYLAAQLQSGAELPYYFFDYIAEIIHVNINVYKLTNGGLLLMGHYNSKPSRTLVATRKGTWQRPTIALLECENYHYEPIGYPDPQDTYKGALAFNFQSLPILYGQSA
ncbi:mRNA capping enzyme [uncultured virus]|nr:mRNA capping enzyme [uncultured virus]